MLFLEIGGSFQIIFLLGLVLLEQFGLHILEQLIDLNRAKLTLNLSANLLL